MKESGSASTAARTDVIDAEGYRPNVGIIVADDRGRLLWAKRIGQQAWQFPQGGINPGEDARDAAYRELHEELGLKSADVEFLGMTRDWLRYKLPRRFIRRGQWPQCIGQRQHWFALRLVGDESAIRFDCGDKAEFDGWRWVDYWHPLKDVVSFKRAVYRKALNELAPLLRQRRNMVLAPSATVESAARGNDRAE